MNNPYKQTYTSGTTSFAKLSTGEAAKGEWASMDWNNAVDRVIIHPGFGIMAYKNNDYADLIINYVNNTYDPVIVAPNSADQNEMQSIKIHYKGTLLERE